MRTLLVLLLSLSLVAAAAPSGTTLQDGTLVLLMTEEKMVSGETPEGSVARFKVDRDVLGPQGQVLIPKGAKAYGKVVKSEGSGFLSKAGELTLSLDSAVAADGTSVPLRAVKESSGDDSQDVMIAGAVVLSLFFLFMEGDDIEIPQGTLMTSYVNRDVKIAQPGAAHADVKAPHSVKMLNTGKVKKDDKMVFACETTPNDAGAYVQLYVDSVLVAGQKGNLTAIVWDTRRTEKLHEKLAEPGPHVVRADVTFANGITAKSAPANFTIED